MNIIHGLNNSPALPSHMANQVVFEGFLVKLWEHDGVRYLRLANNRAPENGGPMRSDYLTVELDPSVVFNAERARLGLRLIVRGRLICREFPETIRTALHKSGHPDVVMKTELANMVILRSTVQIFATFLEFVHSRPAKPARPQASATPLKPGAAATKNQDTGKQEAVEAVAEAPINPGTDLIEVAAGIERTRSKRTTRRRNAQGDLS
jgi:hypothetical protein